MSVEKVPTMRRASGAEAVAASWQGIAAFPSHFERSTSAPTESIDSVPPARRGADGKLQTFVKWQDAHGRTGVSRRPGVELSSSEQELLRDAVKQRANQLCMPIYTASFQRRQVLRCSGYAGDPAANDADPNAACLASRRACVADEAKRFNTLYALAQASIEGRLSFDPPQRANSVSLGQVVRCMQETALPPRPGHLRCTSGYA